MPSVGTGISTTITIDTFTDNTMTWIDNELFGIYLNPDINQVYNPQIALSIISNDPISIIVDNTNYNLTDIASPGTTYIGEHYLNNLSVINGAAVETLDDIYYNTLNITGGTLQADNIFQQGKLNLGNRSTKFAKFLNNLFHPDNNKYSNRVAKTQIEKKENPQRSLRTQRLNDTVKKIETVRLASLSSEKVISDAGSAIQLPAKEENNNTSQRTQRLKETKNPVNPVNPVKKAKTLTPASTGGVDPQYTYDLNGNRASMITPFGIWTYSYDVLNRLISITNPNAEVTSFSYDVLSRRTSMIYPNGVVTTYIYNSDNWLTGMSTDFGATNISSYSYTHDNVGNRVSMTDNSGDTHTYTYDNVYRLVSATHTQTYNLDESFTYDLVGNRQTSQISSSYVYDNLNRLTDDDQFTYSYDNNGNLISKLNKSTVQATNYVYDSESRLIMVTTPLDVVQYQYDGFGRRIAETINGVTTKYVYDREDILFELDGNDQIKAIYTHGPGVDFPISVDRDTNGDGNLDTVFYFHYDGLGSVTAMTNGSGVIVQTYAYDSFGNIVNQTGSVENSYTYTAREWDAEAKLYFYRSRYYSPNIGRFISEDVIKFSGGINFYAMTNNNPVNNSDPAGLCPWCIAGGIIGGGVELASQISNKNGINVSRVMISAATGSLGGGLGTAAAKLSSVVARTLLSTLGSATIGTVGTVANNYADGDCLNKEVGRNALIHGALGAAGSLTSEALSALANKMAINAWNNLSTAQRLRAASNAISRPPSSTPALVSTGNILGNFISNSSPLF